MNTHDDDLFITLNDGTRVLKDGKSVRFRMTAMDSVQRAIAMTMDAVKRRKEAEEPDEDEFAECTGDATFFDSQTAIAREVADSAQHGIFTPQRVRACDGYRTNQPGARYAAGHSDEVLQGMLVDKAEAYRLYDEAVANEYRAPPPGAYSDPSVQGGTHNLRPAAEGSLCTINGYPGHIRNGQCVPDEPYRRPDVPWDQHRPDQRGDNADVITRLRSVLGPDYSEDDLREVAEAVQGTIERQAFGSAASPHDSAAVRQRQHDHAASMDQLYSQRDAELRQAYRRND